MKKLSLILLLFSFVAVLPASALKLIVNDKNNRIVPSRSSGHEAFVQYYEVDDNYTSNNGYRLNKFSYEHLLLLKIYLISFFYYIRNFNKKRTVFITALFLVLIFITVLHLNSRKGLKY